MPRNIVVIGGSAGSLDALKSILGGLPADFPATVLVVLHVSPDLPSMLALLLAKLSSLPVKNPSDREPLQVQHVYVAPPDHHMTVQDGSIRILRGPRENRHRPAIDPLMRSAAREYGSRVVGVVLSGLQDDGSAGLYSVRQRGGCAIVQDPRDAVCKDMPSRAIEYADPHYVLPASDIAPLLIKLATRQQSESTMAAKNNPITRNRNGRNRNRNLTSETGVGKPDANQDNAYFDEGEGVPSVFACPECHGVLWELRNDKVVRFRCRVGHSYGAESLSKELSAGSEAALWAAVRALEEKSAMHRRMAETMATSTSLSSRMLDQSTADAQNAMRIRDMIFRTDAGLVQEDHESRKIVGRGKRKAA